MAGNLDGFGFGEILVTGNSLLALRSPHYWSKLFQSSTEIVSKWVGLGAACR